MNLLSKILKQADDKLDKDEQEWIAHLFDSFNRTYSSSINKYSIIHGDFTDDHILIDIDNKRLGFIDFGDVSIGDPAFDFAGLYISYGKEFMVEILSNYELVVDKFFLERIEEFNIKQLYFMNSYMV